MAVLLASYIPYNWAFYPPRPHVQYSPWRGVVSSSFEGTKPPPPAPSPTEMAVEALPQEVQQEEIKPRRDPPSPLAPRPRTVVSSQVCRVVALSDGTIPHTALPRHLRRGRVLRQMDDIYHAMSHEETRRLRYMDKPLTMGATAQRKSGENGARPKNNHSDFIDGDPDDQAQLITVVRNSLQDAGFELLQARDLALCESLNAGYLLRLSIVPDLADLDEGLWDEFYPEHAKSEDPKNHPADRLLEGKVLIFWRGYDTEVTQGRLLLSKLDYIQTKLVQSAASALKKRLASWERGLWQRIRRMIRAPAAAVQANSTKAEEEDSFFQLARYGGGARRADDPLGPFLIYETEAAEYCGVDNIPEDDEEEDGYEESMIRENDFSSNGSSLHTSSLLHGSLNNFSGDSMANCTVSGISNGEGNDCASNDTSLGESLSQYANGTGFSSPFGAEPSNGTETLTAEDLELYDCINHSELQCPYDQGTEKLPPMQLLRRVSMNNVVDLFSREGRRHLVSSLFAKTELVEPTYKEVVVIWRQKQTQPKPSLRLPQFVYDVADLFDVEGVNDPSAPPSKAKPMPLEIRTFDGTPLANLPAVFPKTKLVFRPADAFVFDLISIVSLGLIFSSSRFDNAKLDLLALVSVIVWLIRLAIRYSNKLARYDLLVKNFLTSKISHRNAGALKYLAAEAGTQRATRAALVHDWLCQQARSEKPSEALMVDRILAEGPAQINELVRNKQVDVDMRAALNDLEDLKLLRIEQVDEQGSQRVFVTCAPSSVEKRLRQAWNNIFRGGLSLRFLTGRR